MGNHADSVNIHIPYAWSYADATARTGASGFVAGDVGKLARQLDNNTLWILTATTPMWVSVSGSASAPAASITEISDEVLAGDGAFADVAFAVDTYDEIWIRARVRTADAGATDRVLLRVGNTTLDSGNNYAYVTYWQGSSASGAQSVATSGISSSIIAGNGADAGFFSDAQFSIFDPSDISTYRLINTQGGAAISSSYRTGHGSGLWKNTADKINILNIIGVTTATFKAGSRLRVLGITYG